MPALAAGVGIRIRMFQLHDCSQGGCDLLTEFFGSLRTVRKRMLEVSTPDQRGLSIPAELLALASGVRTNRIRLLISGISCIQVSNYSLISLTGHHHPFALYFADFPILESELPWEESA